MLKSSDYSGAIALLRSRVWTNHNFLRSAIVSYWLYCLPYSCSSETSRRDIPEWKEFKISPNYQIGMCLLKY